MLLPETGLGLFYFHVTFTGDPQSSFEKLIDYTSKDQSSQPRLQDALKCILMDAYLRVVAEGNPMLQSTKQCIEDDKSMVSVFEKRFEVTKDYDDMVAFEDIEYRVCVLA